MKDSIKTHTAEEVASYLNIQSKHVKRLVKAGKLTAIDIRENPNDYIDLRFIRVTDESLKQFMKNRIVFRE